MHQQGAHSITLRRATRADAPALVNLITALAEFENLTPPDEAAHERIVEDGFGDRPRFEAWLAFYENRAEPVGYALFFEMYSTFLARPTLFLEDLFVLPEFRHRGIGKALLHRCIQIAHERDCGRMEWTCLDWNTRAQKVYEGLGAERLSQWLIYRLHRDQILALGRSMRD